jgi:4-hydroxybenzoate polyprenyltransferase
MLRHLLTLARVSNLPTVWSNVLAAWLIAGGAASWHLLPLLLGASLLYSGGCTLNDAFDARWDATYRPERLIPSGALSRRAVWHMGSIEMALGLACIFLSGLLPWETVHALLLWLAVLYAGGFTTATLPARAPDSDRDGAMGFVLRRTASTALMAFGFWGLWSAGTAQVRSALGLCAAILLYDAWHKQSPWSVVTMGACRWLLYVTAALTSGGESPGTALAAGGVLWLYIIILSLVARGEAKHTGDNAPRTRLLLLAVPVALAALGYALGLRGLDIAIPALFLTAGGVMLLPHRKTSTGTWVNRLLAAIPWLDFSLVLMWVLLSASEDAGIYLALFPAAVALSLLFQRWFKAT